MNCAPTTQVPGDQNLQCLATCHLRVACLLIPPLWQNLSLASVRDRQSPAALSAKLDLPETDIVGDPVAFSCFCSQAIPDPTVDHLTRHQTFLAFCLKPMDQKKKPLPIPQVNHGGRDLTRKTVACRKEALRRTLATMPDEDQDNR